MRVLYLTLNPNRAGTTVPTEGWLRLLRPRGLEPVLVSSQSGAFQEWVRSQGIPTYDVPLPHPSRRRPFAFGAALASLIRIARRHRVQLVHSNEHDVYPSHSTRRVYCPFPAWPACTSRWTGRSAPGPSAEAGRRNRLFFVSRSSQETCRPALTGIVPERSWHVLRNGLNLGAFCPDQTRRAEGRQRLGTGSGALIGVACALRPRKQLEHLFRAAAGSTHPCTWSSRGGRSRATRSTRSGCWPRVAACLASGCTCSATWTSCAPSTTPWTCS